MAISAVDRLVLDRTFNELVRGFEKVNDQMVDKARKAGWSASAIDNIISTRQDPKDLASTYFLQYVLNVGLFEPTIAAGHVYSLAFAVKSGGRDSEPFIEYAQELAAGKYPKADIALAPAGKA